MLPFAIGCDRCINLSKICGSRSFEVSIADALVLPYREGIFDVVICIALIHHLSTYANRIRVLRELVRICKVGGQILVTAWALEQNTHAKRQFGAQDVMVPWKLHSKYLTDKTGNDDWKSELETKKTLQSEQFEIEEENNSVVLQRYCHVYKQFELEELWKQIPNVVVEESFFDVSYLINSNFILGW